MINQEKLETTVSTGLDALNKILEMDTPTKEQLARARLGASVLSSATRYEGTRNSMVSLRFRVAQAVLKDSKQRRKYLAASSPELKLLTS